MFTRHFQLDSLAAMQQFAGRLADMAQPPLLIALSGTLGAGKTQFVRFAAAALGIPAEEVTSPTYVLVQRYRGKHVLYHFDFYRLKSSQEVWDLGIEEMLEQQAIVFVEWADMFPDCLPDDYLHIELAPSECAASESRRVSCTARGPKSEQLLLSLDQATTNSKC
jgi:tRNA threonylcarbamoyladenosine biosynthesis protein TsaE